LEEKLISSCADFSIGQYLDERLNDLSFWSAADENSPDVSALKYFIESALKVSKSERLAVDQREKFWLPLGAELIPQFKSQFGRAVGGADAEKANTT
jgi:hypothetical protein